jgi:hypothetical protein
MLKAFERVVQELVSVPKLELQVSGQTWLHLLGTYALLRVVYVVEQTS